MQVILSALPRVNAVSVSFLAAASGFSSLCEIETASYIGTTSHNPSLASTSNSRSSLISCSLISGSATTNCFSIRLPKARDIAKTPPTLQVPTHITTPPAFSILFLSSLLFGL
nr:ATPase, F1 complex, beta subunit [Ipomoea batatas]